jgi:hypothetical protein
MTSVTPSNSTGGLLEALPMAGTKKTSDRVEFPITFLLSIIAGLLAFLLVWLVSAALEVAERNLVRF